ncbi:oligosaccharide flippase family protein [Vibrio sp. 1865]|uniref:oligosaccharide flippase family protein n=1 Tax=unclassified Vibrio TaxID=2614977 RepID=UPI00296572AE|nr:MULTISPECIES: oligosaccharide flippase family protein [unclassified Vibrio]MDW2092042.1 oligosaccharide flippase family protein [Vibrio sp. 1866]MDW3102131.1 oligosaccharide flippase family protein [Vibrio sp. 1874]MDW3199801.1 oligosaccharide flippase family protein [Vibrio sp. 1865]
MFDQIVKKIRSNGRVLKNISYLGLIQIFNLCFPFVTYPYLISKLGLHLYGEVILYQTAIAYVSILVNYGFNISGVRLISKSKSELETNKIVTTIYLIKLSLFLISIIFLCVLLGVYEKINHILLLSSLTLVFNELLFPQWYFQAKEKLKFVTLLSFVVKLVSLFSLFLFIKSELDYIYVPLMTGVGYLIVGIVSSYLLYKNKVRLVAIDYKQVRSIFTESSHFFLTSAVISIKNKFDIFIVGAIIGKEAVAIYDMALKIYNISLMPISVINNAIFAHMAKGKNTKFLKSTLKNTFLVSIIICTVVYFISPVAIEVMSNGNRVDDIHSILAVLLISIPLFSVGLTLAQNGLIVQGFSKLHLLGMISTTVVYLTGVGIIFAIGVETKLSAYATLTVLVYLYEMLYRIYFCRKYKIL